MSSLYVIHISALFSAGELSSSVLSASPVKLLPVGSASVDAGVSMNVTLRLCHSGRLVSIHLLCFAVQAVPTESLFAGLVLEVGQQPRHC